MTMHVTVSAAFVQMDPAGVAHTLVEAVHTEVVPDSGDLQTNALTAASMLERFLAETSTSTGIQMRSLVGKASDDDMTHTRRRAARPHRG